MVKQNVVVGGYGDRDRGHGTAERVAVDNNEVLDVSGVGIDAGASTTPPAEQLRRSASCCSADSAVAAGNTVARIGLQALVRASLRAGDPRPAADDIRVSGNVVRGGRSA